MKILITTIAIFISCLACWEQKEEEPKPPYHFYPQLGEVMTVEQFDRYNDSGYGINRSGDTIRKFVRYRVSTANTGKWTREPTVNDDILTMLTEINKKMDELIELQENKKK